MRNIAFYKESPLHRLTRCLRQDYACPNWLVPTSQTPETLTKILKEKGNTMNSSDKQKMITIMKENSLHAYLATCDGDQPRVRPVSPIVENNLSVWVTTYRSSRKVKQIEQNSKICIAFVEQPRGDKAAILIGEAKIIPDLEEKKRIWNLATFDLSEHFEGPESEKFCLLKIIIKKIEWRDSWTVKVRIYEPPQE